MAIRIEKDDVVQPARAKSRKLYRMLGEILIGAMLVYVGVDKWPEHTVSAVFCVLAGAAIAIDALLMMRSTVRESGLNKTAKIS